MRIGVLASGSGTNLAAILDAELPVVVVVVDRPCGATEVAEARRRARRARRAHELRPDFDRDAYTDGWSTRSSATTSIWSPWPASGPILEKPMSRRLRRTGSSTPTRAAAGVPGVARGARTRWPTA